MTITQPPESTRRAIGALFERMANIHQSEDYASITEIFDAPVMMADHRHMLVYDDPERIRSLLPQVCEAYRQMGVARSQIASMRFSVSSDAFQMVDVCWRQLDAAGAPLFEFDVTYAFRLVGRSWRIAFVANHNEHERWPSAKAAMEERSPAALPRQRRESAA